jgi:hypothetical protein
VCVGGGGESCSPDRHVGRDTEGVWVVMRAERGESASGNSDCGLGRG